MHAEVAALAGGLHACTLNNVSSFFCVHDIITRIHANAKHFRPTAAQAT